VSTCISSTQVHKQQLTRTTRSWTYCNMYTLIYLQKQLSHNCPLKQVKKTYNGKYVERMDASLNGSTV